MHYNYTRLEVRVVKKAKDFNSHNVLSNVTTENLGHLFTTLLGV